MAGLELLDLCNKLRVENIYDVILGSLRGRRLSEHLEATSCGDPPLQIEMIT